MPWYAALLIAITATAIGYGIDAGQKELTHVFAGFYIAGCVVAVLAVRQEGLFTAIIQPPLILFCAVPGAYWLFHGGKIGHLKDLLINCGYPLIERFPLMLGTAGFVLLIGLVRWHFGSRQTTAAATPDDTATARTAGAKAVVTDLVAKLRTMLRPESGFDADDDTDEAAQPEARRRRQSGAASKARRSARSGRSGTGSAPTRSRRTRPSRDDEPEPVERPRRSSRRDPAGARDYDPTEAPRRSRRRPRPDADPDDRAQSPRESRRDPRSRRNPYERPAPRSSRFDGLDGYGDRYEPPGPSDHFGRYDTYDYERYEPRRRTPTGTHHPISQVRYRGAASPDEPRAEPRERRSRSRTQGRSPRRPPAESWEYDL